MVSPPQALGNFHCCTLDPFSHTIASFNLFSGESQSSATRFSGYEEEKRFSTSLIVSSWDCSRAVFSQSICIPLLNGFPPSEWQSSSQPALTWPSSERGRVPEACNHSSALLHLFKGPWEIRSDSHKEWTEEVQSESPGGQTAAAFGLVKSKTSWSSKKGQEE